MTKLPLPQNAELVAAVLDQAERRVTQAERQQLLPFVRAYFDACGSQEFPQREPRDSYAITYQLWRFMQSLQPGEIKVSLFNPSFEQHGWQSKRTTVAVLIQNSPFIVDSIRMEMIWRNFAIHNIHSAVMTAIRDANGELQSVCTGHPGPSGNTALTQSSEALVFLEVTRQSDSEMLREIEANLREILAEVQAVVGDFEGMKEKAQQLVEVLRKRSPRPPAENAAELRAAEFIDWMLRDNFTFLGYQCIPRELERPALQRRFADHGLGMFRLAGAQYVDDVALELSQSPEKPEHNGAVLRFSKAALRSRIHRDAYPDYISLRIPSESGADDDWVEHRFLGLFTSHAYSHNPRDIPLVADKVKAVQEALRLDPRSHYGKELAQIITTFPQDELLLSSEEQLISIIGGVLKIQERNKVRLFMRPDRFGKFMSCLVYTPREVYKTEVRRKIETLLADALGASDSNFTTYFSESVLTRTHFVFKLDPTRAIKPDVIELRRAVARAAVQWSDALSDSLVEEFGEEQGSVLMRMYGHAFSAGFQDDFEPRTAIGDINKINLLSESNRLETKVYRRLEEDGHVLHFRLYHLDDAMALSDLLPPLENMGLHVQAHSTYTIERADGMRVHVHDFTLSYGLTDTVDLDRVGAKFQEGFRRVWEGDAESDGFNKLLLGAGLDWREIALLRSYARYMKQISFSFRERYIAETLGKYLQLTADFIDLFKYRFDPDEQSVSEFEAKLQQVQAAIEQVDNLNEDSIFREYLAIMQATVRSNYFQRDEQGRSKTYLSFKLQPALIPNVPVPVPLFETFVYSPKVEGVHLRGGRVARGGLRWSDRSEDFRTEVLGLVKAQQVKNSVIVPVGAKGGFVAKTIPHGAERDVVQAAGVDAYKTFISGLLDLADNIVDGAIVGPEAVVRHDEDDPYLVVAADKGTATFSDIANSLAEQYGFWLGDAFASGGSVGYDHKGMGITARGAWVSVQRHFREMGVDIQTSDFSVLGIGDMQGDVFGNGMLLSEHICLKAAFNHLHIFIDPYPDAASSFKERQRLFALPRSNWEDYNRELISKGGGVFSRSEKYIAISQEMREAFDIEEDRLAPNDLIKALLCARVDLLWNGGIGTYVKAGSESHLEVGDKANDVLRVNAAELRCKVIGEGGNLGLTQLGRVEFALAGGAVNTDFIDNAAGVDCSDHEVNIKILLNDVVQAGDMTGKQRRELLEQMTEDVSALVLRNNYKQAQAISIAQAEASLRSAEYRRVLVALEEQGILIREQEDLPEEEQLNEREARGEMLTRPELAVLISYIKTDLKEKLCAPEICDQDSIARIVETAFPEQLVERFPERIQSHRLHCEILATQLANDMVNHMGLTFVHRMMQSPGTRLTDVALAYVSARDVFAVPRHWQMIEALDGEVDAGVQIRLMAELMRLMRRASHWFLRNRPNGIDPAQEAENTRPCADYVSRRLGDLLQGGAAEQWQQREALLLAQNIPAELARYLASAGGMFASLKIAEIVHLTGRDTELVAKSYFKLAEALDLRWFIDQISGLPVQNQWQALARESFRDEVQIQHGHITCSLLAQMNSDADWEAGVAAWLADNNAVLGRWQDMIKGVQAANAEDSSVFTVATQGLADLAQQCKPASPFRY